MLTLGMLQSPVNGQFDGTFELSDLDGENGMTLNGSAQFNYSGTSVSSAGDINGDGFDDFIIGADRASVDGVFGAGSAYVLFGSSDGLPSPFNLSDINSLNGFSFNGYEQSEAVGFSVSSAGDVNGDGLDDLIVGTSIAGKSYVVFGSDSQFPNPFSASTINGDNGFLILQAGPFDRAGRAVSGAGDINGDGFDDIIIGAYKASPNGNQYAGSSHVIFGTDKGFPNPFELSGINALNGITINGISANDKLGFSVSSAGDVNGDGIDDVIVGAPETEFNGDSWVGSVYVIFGSDSGLANPFNMSTLNGQNGFAIHGIDASDRTGDSVSSAGDVNGDGIDDLLIGASIGGDNSTGVAYVIYGTELGFPHPFELSSINALNGFTLVGIENSDQFGRSVRKAGDVNGDGIDDLILGAWSASPNGINDAGSSYVVYGSQSLMPNPFNLASLDGRNGFSINGINEGDFSGFAVSGAGDVNGDGLDDVIIGAWRADPNGIENAGSSYLLFGDDTIFKNDFD
ncbi:MAG: FG-GAP repeat protein [Xanthomonadales bacterium]|nr:FG-GAP repeat protein [Xanthomonadales bacterium]